MPWHYNVHSDTVNLISTFRIRAKYLGHLIAVSEIKGKAGWAALHSMGPLRQICQVPPYHTGVAPARSTRDVAFRTAGTRPRISPHRIRTQNLCGSSMSGKPWREREALIGNDRGFRVLATCLFGFEATDITTVAMRLEERHFYSHAMRRS